MVQNPVSAQLLFNGNSLPIVTTEPELNKLVKEWQAGNLYSGAITVFEEGEKGRVDTLTLYVDYRNLVAVLTDVTV